MTTGEKVSYVKGLVEGAELKLGTNERKVLDSILEILGELAEDVNTLNDDVEDLYDYSDDLSDALDYLGSAVFDDEDECGYDEDDENPMYEIECSNCHQMIHVDEDTLLGGDINCPNCGEKLEFELCDCDDCSDECDDEGCDCHHHGH